MQASYISFIQIADKWLANIFILWTIFSFWLLSYKAEIFWIFDQVGLTYSYFCCLWSHCYDHEILLLFSFRQWGSYRFYVYVYYLFWVHLCIKCSNSFLWMDIQLYSCLPLLFIAKNILSILNNLGDIVRNQLALNLKF